MMNMIGRISVLLLLLTACGGGGGGGDPTGPGGGGTTTISGTAAAGAPIVGIVNIKGANGATASSAIELDGYYSIDVSNLTAPYILYAEGAVGDKTISIYSAAVSAGTINITPITDFILRNALGAPAEGAYDNWNSVQVDESSLIEAENDVQNQLAPMLAGAGVATEVDLISTAFDTNHTGMDAVLDGLDISYNGSMATITNNLTGSSYTDDISLANDGTGLPASDQGATAAALTDRQEMDRVWQSLSELFADAMPSSAELTTWFNSNVAPDYLDRGHDRTQALDDWLYGEGSPSVGLVLSVTVIEPMDMAGTSYVKGYWTRIYYTDSENSGSVSASMVFDGSDWLWYGNRRWVDEEGPRSDALMYVGSTGQIWFETGLSLSIGDDFNYAYNQGVRSAIITGPGLPAEGVVLEHRFPVNDLQIYPSSRGLYIADDATLSAIMDNAQYLTRLCSEPAADLFNGTATCTTLHAYTTTNMKPPVLGSELSSAMFASLTHPVFHNASELNFGGQISISWTKPANTENDDISLVWSNSGTQYELETDLEGNITSAVTLDATGLPEPDSIARLFVRIKDKYRRVFNMGWELQ
jgi:hypothetical protein